MFVFYASRFSEADQLCIRPGTWLHREKHCWSTAILGSNWSPLVVPNCETLKENVFYGRLMHKKFITLRKMPAKTVLKALSSGRPLSKTTGATWFLNLIGIIQIDGSPLTALRSLLLRIFIFTGDRGSDFAEALSVSNRKQCSLGLFYSYLLLVIVNYSFFLGRSFVCL